MKKAPRLCTICDQPASWLSTDDYTHPGYPTCSPCLLRFMRLIKRGKSLKITCLIPGGAPDLPDGIYSRRDPHPPLPSDQGPAHLH